MKHGWTAQEIHSFICTFEGVQAAFKKGRDRVQAECMQMTRFWEGRCPWLKVTNYPGMGCATLWGSGLYGPQCRSESGLTLWFEVSVGRSEGECRPLLRKGLLVFMAGS